MLYMVIEHYGPGIAAQVYRRFRDRGRLAPVRTSAEAAAFISPQL